MSRPPLDMKSLIGLVAGGEALSEADAQAAFDVMMSGDATPAQIGGFLMALRVRRKIGPRAHRHFRAIGGR